jgi:histidinol-phosphatase (PHP family)
MFLANFHTHSFFCDGSDNPEAYILSAIEQKMDAIGFSAHSPLPLENNYSIKKERVLEYRNLIRLLQQKYKDKIQVFLSVEYDFVPVVSDDIKLLNDSLNPDYVIASVHLVRNSSNGELWFIDGPDSNYISGIEKVFNNDIKAGVENYYRQIQQMATTIKPDIIGHLDKIKMNNKNRFFTQDEPWYRNLVLETLEIIALSGCIVEVNTRGIYKKRSPSLFPEEWVLKEMLSRKIPVTISSDAHSPLELCMCFKDAINTLLQVGYKNIKVFDKGLWRNEFLL